MADPQDKPALMPIGMRFRVNAEATFAPGGFTIARYLPAEGMSYRVTEINREFVSDLFAKGIAAIDLGDVAITGAVAGSVAVNK